MEKIKEIIICITTVSLLIGYAKNLVLDKYKPYIKLISGILILLLLTEPVISSLYDFSNELKFDEIIQETPEGDSDYSAYIGVFKKTLCRSVEDFIVQNSGITRENISVDVKLDSDDITNIALELIIITVHNDDKTEIPESLIKSFYGCNTEVVYGD